MWKVKVPGPGSGRHLAYRTLLLANEVFTDVSLSQQRRTWYSGPVLCIKKRVILIKVRTGERAGFREVLGMEFASNLQRHGSEFCLDKKPAVFAKRVSVKITAANVH